MIRLLAHSPSPLSFSVFLDVAGDLTEGRRGEEVGEEQSHTMARKLGPL
jgi:hypothetical protein